MMVEKKLRNNYHNFFLSNWYSGATVLSLLINNHRDITCNGETFPFRDEDLEQLICSCSKTIIDCDFYKFSANCFRINGSYDLTFFGRTPVVSNLGSLQKISDTFYHFSLIRDLICNFIPDYSGKIKNFILMHEKFFKLACQYSRSKIYLDGTKSIRRAELFAQYSDQKIRVIHNIRDGRRFVASYLLNHGLSDKDIPIIAKKWIHYIEMVKMLLKRYPYIELKEVRHEDLCNNKEAVIKDVCDFLDVEYDPEVFKFNDANHHILGNTMRRSFNGDVRESDRWKSAYTGKNFDELTERLRGYLMQYDYL